MSAHVELDEVTVAGAGRLRLGPFTGTFAPSSVTAVIGGDGAGKSTLLSLLAGRLSSPGCRRIGIASATSPPTRACGETSGSRRTSTS